MKTISASRTTLYFSCLLIGAVLVLSPALGMAASPRMSGTTYSNTSGEAATLVVTNNNFQAQYNIRAAGACGNVGFGGNFTTVLPIGDKISGVGCNKIEVLIPPSSITGHQTYEGLWEVGGFIESSPGQGQWSDFPATNSGYAGYFLTGSTFLQNGCAYRTFNYAYETSTCHYGPETLSSYLESLHSVYMFTGTGASDTVNLNGGLTQDTYSIVIPGVDSTVNINSGIGNSTYNIVVGQYGIINLNAYYAAGGNNIYNLVY